MLQTSTTTSKLFAPLLELLLVRFLSMTSACLVEHIHVTCGRRLVQFLRQYGLMWLNCLGKSCKPVTASDFGKRGSFIDTRQGA